MCTDIIFHIGYPKTATTLLQRGMFRKIPALGVDSVILGAEQLEFDIRKMVHLEQMGKWASLEGQSFAERIFSLGGNVNPILYSSEYWLRGPLHSYPAGARPLLPSRYTHLATDHLYGFKKHAWKNRGRVRAMVTLRNQDSWLGSLYAQNSDRRPHAGQKDFEDFVRCVMEDESPGGRLFLDYDCLYEDLCSVLGAENVLVLLFEAVGQPSFKKTFLEWAGYPPFGDEAEMEIRHNVRRVESNKWKTRPNSWLVRTRPFDVLDYMVKKTTGLDIRKPVKKAVAAMSHTEIMELTPQLATYIREHYRDSNARLSRKLGLGLERYGYC